MDVIVSLAPQIDRLVWAVSGLVKARYQELPASSALSARSFGTLLNVLMYPDDLSETFIRRRYAYRPPEVLKEFFEEIETGGYLDRDGDRLTPTPLLAPIIDEAGAALVAAGRQLWGEYGDDVKTASLMARQVMETGPVRDGLLQVALAADEADDRYHRFWQRLSGLRLLRNEAHVDAWRSFDLGPREVEALTAAWAGAEVQAPVVYSERLIERGLAENGAATAAGLAIRQQIEDATNEGVASAFAAVDNHRMLEILAALPPQD